MRVKSLYDPICICSSLIDLSPEAEINSEAFLSSLCELLSLFLTADDTMLMLELMAGGKKN